MSTIRQGEIIPNSGKPGFTFALNSNGGSTNRFSRQELPFFGVVKTSRVDEIVNSAQTMQFLKEASEKLNESCEFRSPSDQQYH